MTPMIQLKDVVKTQEANCGLAGVSFCVREGESVRILSAPSDGGKAVLRLTAAMDRPDAGEIVVSDVPVHSLDDEQADDFRNQHIGWASNAPAFWNELTVLENITMPLTIRGAPAWERKKAGGELLAAVGLAHVMHAYPVCLSGYERRLAGVSRALMAQPEVLLLDDVLAGLSGEDAEKLAEKIEDLRTERKTTLLSYTGNPRDEIHVDRTILLQRGKIGRQP